MKNYNNTKMTPEQYRTKKNAEKQGKRKKGKKKK